MATLEIKKDGTLKGMYRFWDITIEESDESGEKYLSVDCSGGELVLPEGITALGEYCLREETDLISVVFPSTVKRVERAAFRDCENLTKIIFNDGLEYIGAEAFEGCKRLTEVVFPATLVEIGAGAFGYCHGLRTVGFGRGIVSIGDAAFLGCGVSELVLPDGLSRIGKRAFFNCTQLKKIILPSTLTELGEGVLADCGRLREIKSESERFVYEDGFLTDVRKKKILFAAEPYIPDGTREIGAYAYEAVSEKITELTVPASVVRIGRGVFSGFKRLKELVLPEGITAIEEEAFRDCRSIERVHLPESLKTIGKKAFCGCDGLEKINLPAGAEILDYAFRGCDALCEATVGGEKLHIGAFSDCQALASVRFYEGLKVMESSVFKDCKALKTVALPDSLTVVGRYAFENCTALTEIDINVGVRKIAEGAFYNCTALEKINLPNTVTEIEPYAFAYCGNLRDMRAQDGGKYYVDGGCIIEGDGVLVYGLGGRVPEGVTKIGDYIFAERDFKEIYLPSSLKSVGFYAFDECKNIETVHFAGTLKQWQAIDFHADEYWNLQAYGDHEDDDGVPNWYFTRCCARLICADGEGEVFLY